jgi:hypothetical protein
MSIFEAFFLLYENNEVELSFMMKFKVSIFKTPLLLLKLKAFDRLILKLS